MNHNSPIVIKTSKLFKPKGNQGVSGRSSLDTPVSSFYKTLLRNQSHQKALDKPKAKKKSNKPTKSSEQLKLRRNSFENNARLQTERNLTRITSWKFLDSGLQAQPKGKASCPLKVPQKSIPEKIATSPYTKTKSFSRLDQQKQEDDDLKRSNNRQ